MNILLIEDDRNDFKIEKDAFEHCLPEALVFPENFEKLEKDYKDLGVASTYEQVKKDMDQYKIDLIIFDINLWEDKNVDTDKMKGFKVMNKLLNEIEPKFNSVPYFIISAYSLTNCEGFAERRTINYLDKTTVSDYYLLVDELKREGNIEYARYLVDNYRIIKSFANIQSIDNKINSIVDVLNTINDNTAQIRTIAELLLSVSPKFLNDPDAEKMFIEHIKSELSDDIEFYALDKNIKQQTADTIKKLSISGAKELLKVLGKQVTNLDAEKVAKLIISKSSFLMGLADSLKDIF